MNKIVVRLAGEDMEVSLPPKSQRPWITDVQAYRRAVVKAYLDTPTRCEMEDTYTLTRCDEGNTTVLDTGTLQQAYASLASEDRIELFMEHARRLVGGDLDRLGELPWSVKYLLASSQTS